MCLIGSIKRVFIFFILVFSCNSFSALFTPLTTAQLIADMTTADANGQNDTIDLGGNTFILTVGSFSAIGTFDTGLPIVTEAGFSLTIMNGTIRRSLVADPFRILAVDSTGTLSLDGVTIENGLAFQFFSSFGTFDYEPLGGAIYSTGTIPLINNSVFTNNSAVGNDTIDDLFNLGTKFASGGAIFSDGTITTISNTRFQDNSARGGIAFLGLGGVFTRGSGGAIENDGTIGSITNSQFINNMAVGGAGNAVLGVSTGGPGGDRSYQREYF
jgi:hypothetical protein